MCSNFWRRVFRLKDSGGMIGGVTCVKDGNLTTVISSQSGPLYTTGSISVANRLYPPPPKTIFRPSKNISMHIRVCIRLQASCIGIVENVGIKLTRFVPPGGTKRQNSWCQNSRDSRCVRLTRLESQLLCSDRDGHPSMPPNWKLMWRAWAPRKRRVAQHRVLCICPQSPWFGVPRCCNIQRQNDATMLQSPQHAKLSQWKGLKLIRSSSSSSSSPQVHQELEFINSSSSSWAQVHWGAWKHGKASIQKESQKTLGSIHFKHRYT